MNQPITSFQCDAALVILDPRQDVEGQAITRRPMEVRTLAVAQADVKAAYPIGPTGALSKKAAMAKIKNATFAQASKAADAPIMLLDTADKRVSAAVVLSPAAPPAEPPASQVPDVLRYFELGQELEGRYVFESMPVYHTPCSHYIIFYLI